MGIVVPLGNITRLDLPTERILDGAKGSCTDGVVVMGYNEDGSLYFASSLADGGSVLWLLEMCKMALLDAD